MADVLHEPHQTLVPVNQRQRVEAGAHAQQLVLVVLALSLVHRRRRRVRRVALLVRRDVTLEPANLAKVPRARVEVALVVHDAESGVQSRVHGEDPVVRHRVIQPGPEPPDVAFVRRRSQVRHRRE